MKLTATLVRYISLTNLSFVRNWILWAWRRTWLTASPPIGCNGHAKGGWAGAKSGARLRVPATPHRSHSCSRLPENPKFGTKHCLSLLGAAYLGLSGVWSEEMTTASSRPRSEVWRGRPGFNRCRVTGSGPCRPKSTGRAVGVPVGANGGDALTTSMFC